MIQSVLPLLLKMRLLTASVTPGTCQKWKLIGPLSDLQNPTSSSGKHWRRTVLSHCQSDIFKIHFDISLMKNLQWPQDKVQHLAKGEGSSEFNCNSFLIKSINTCWPPAIHQVFLQTERMWPKSLLSWSFLPYQGRNCPLNSAPSTTPSPMF